MDDGINVLLNFLQRQGGVNGKTRAVATVAAFLSDDRRLFALLSPENSLQEDLVLEILSAGDARQASKLLWWPVGPFVTPQTFISIYRSLLPASSDLAVLYALTGAAVDFLRPHPRALTISQDSAERLLNSDDCDHRVVGLKALRRHSGVSLAQMLVHIDRALKSESWQERCGGLHELLHLLEESDRQAMAPVGATGFAELEETLAGIREGSLGESVDLRPMAEECAILLAQMRQQFGKR